MLEDVREPCCWFLLPFGSCCKLPCLCTQALPSPRSEDRKSSRACAHSQGIVLHCQCTEKAKEVKGVAVRVKSTLNQNTASGQGNSFAFFFRFLFLLIILLSMYRFLQLSWKLHSSLIFLCQYCKASMVTCLCLKTNLSLVDGKQNVCCANTE